MIRVLQVPYDSGFRDQRMGRGPSCLVASGAMERLVESAGAAERSTVEYDGDFPTENATAFALQRMISEQVRAAVARGEFPLVLAGNCNSTVGALGGLGSRNPALIWFDAHGDFNTPETSTSGFLDGMALAMVVGHCWRSMTGSVSGFRPLPEDRVALVGARDFDDAEHERLRNSGVNLVRCEEIRDGGAAVALEPVLDGWSGQVDGVYLHIDVDVHDPQSAPFNPYQPTGGLSPEEVRRCLTTAAGSFRILGASVTAYAPDLDVARKGLGVGLDLISCLGGLARQQ